MSKQKHNRTERDELSPAGALLHPVWILALVALVLNDHLLKDLFHTPWFTGKLSDFAGLIVAPTLLAALLRVRRRRGLWACTAAVVAVFSAINLSPAAAGAWGALMDAVAFGWVTTSSATDLVALPAAPLGLYLLEPTMRRAASEHGGPQSQGRKLATWSLAMIGGLACVATSPPPETPPRGQQTFQARVALHNKTHELQVFRVRQLRDNITLDCERVSEAPQQYLTDRMFGQPTRWELLSDQQIGLDTGVAMGGGAGPLKKDECDAAYIATETADDIVVFWTGKLEAQTFAHNPTGSKEDSGKAPAIEMWGDYFRVAEEDMNPYRAEPCQNGISCGLQGRQELAQTPDGVTYAWRSNTEDDTKMHFEWPDRNAEDRIEIPRSCETRGAGEGLAWEELPRNSRKAVVGFDVGEDGCHTLSVASPNASPNGQPETNDYLICAPEAALAPLKPTDGVAATVEAVPVVDLPSSGPRYSGLRLTVERGAERGEIWLTRGTSIPNLEGIELHSKLRNGCGPIQASCDQMEVAADLHIAGQERRLKPGESASFTDRQDPVHLHLVRSIFRATAMPADACEGDPTEVERLLGGQPGGYVEAATVVGLEAGE